MCTSSIHPGEFPPPPLPCIGRDKLIEEIICLVENLTPIALIGAGGIGKTSIALALLNDNRIKKRFGENRRFIRCDKFPSTLPHFLCQLSNVIGAGVENPEDLAPLRSFLSSKEMLIVLDNAESVLDPKGMDGQRIYNAVEELGQFKTICLCITSRLRTVPRFSKCPTIPTLSVEAACSIFYNIHDTISQSDSISNILKQLDFHALSITLLATTASYNMWDHERLVKEWDMQHTQVLQTDHNESLAATIELSLTSPMFRELGSNARDLLGVIAFFPQGVNCDNLEWLFPSLTNTQKIIDKFCVLSLTYQSNHFVTMLSPLRDYLCPKDPKSSPLLCETKGSYFSRLAVHVSPSQPSFEEAKWIMSEDVNVEHLLDVFISTDANQDDICDACTSFMRHLSWHKPRLVMLGPKLKGLPDNCSSKLVCLNQLSRLLRLIGKFGEQKELLSYTLELWRKQGDNFQVAATLEALAMANQHLSLYTEGIQHVKESLEIFKQLNHIPGQIDSLNQLAELLHGNEQFDAAEEVATKSINLLLEKGNYHQYRVSKGYLLLGEICYSKGETEKATKHFETVLGVAPSNWHGIWFGVLSSLANLSFDQGKFKDAHGHIEHAKSHAVNDTYCLASAMKQQAGFWYKEGRLEEAKSEVLHATSEFEKLGVVRGIEECRKLLKMIEGK